MSVTLSEEGVIELVGACDSADAETLLEKFLETPDAAVDWRACTAAHTAIVQVLLAAAKTPLGPPRGRFLIDIVEPLLKRR